MKHQVFISAHRAFLPNLFAEHIAIKHLAEVGFPVRYSWRFPLDARFADFHSVDFSLLNQPGTVSDLLLQFGVPDWMHSLKDWASFLAIGTWSIDLLSSLVVMKWHLCVNIDDGTIFRVVTEAASLRLSFDCTRNMLEADVDLVPAFKILESVQSECVMFVNSTPSQMMACLDLYFSFVNGTISTAEAFLVAIGKIDPPANAVGASWYALVADCLVQSEY